jgi:hypothetical protein
MAWSLCRVHRIQLHAAHIHHKLDDAGILLHEVMEVRNLPLKLVQIHYPSHTFQSQKSVIQHTDL